MAKRKRTNSSLNGASGAPDKQVSGSAEDGDNGGTALSKPFSVVSPLPYVPTGRRFDLKYESQTGQPIDSGDPLVRKYSPFVLQFLPPADAQAFLGEMKKKKSNTDQTDVALLGKALSELYNINQTNELGASLSSYNSLESLAEQQAYRNLSAGEGKESSFIGSGQTLSYLSQLFALMNMPPLQFLINPNSMNITYTKIQDFSARTRKNRVFKAWGEDQPKITFSARTGAFVAMGTTQAIGDNSFAQQFVALTTTSTNQSLQSPSGVQYASKRYSLAFQHFMEILQLYQNACLIYDTLFDTEAHLGVGSFMIHYDQMTYEGLIESFDYAYNEETPHSLEFNFDFTVSKMYDWNSQQGSPKRINAPNRRDRRRRF